VTSSGPRAGAARTSGAEAGVTGGADTGDDVLATGPFSAWLRATEATIADGADAQVPCGACAGCCTASQFIHIAPDERDTLACIPAELTFPAPGLPRGHVVLGYDQRGHCPMLVDGRCSIYDHRPRTCRRYDCRVFAATDLGPGEEKPAIIRQVRRWRFDEPTSLDRVEREACQAAAAYLADHADALPLGAAARNPVALAALAIAAHPAFLGRDVTSGEPVVVEPDVAAVQRVLDRRAPRAADPDR
jgi:Fe-S-cluster containining protein